MSSEGEVVMKRPRKPSKLRPDQAMASAVRFAVERLEQRVLLSGDPLAQDDADAIKAGLQGVVNWAETVETFSSFGQTLPLIGDIPAINESLGSISNFSQFLQDKLADPIEALGNTPSTDQIKAALLAGLGAGSTVDIIEAGGKVQFDVTASLAGTPTNVNLNLGSNAHGLGLDASTQFSLTTKLDLDFSFGIDLADGLAASEAFYVNFNPGGFAVSADIDAKSFSVALGGKVGFLEVAVGDGSTSSFIDLDADISLGLNDPDASGEVTLTELIGTSLSSLLAMPGGAVTGTLNASIPVSASLGTFSAGGTISLVDSALFDGTAPTIGFTSTSDPLKNFKNIGPRDMVVLLQQLGASLQGITDSLAPIGGIPFLESSIDKVLNFGESLFEYSGGYFNAIFSGADNYVGSSAAPSDGVLEHVLKNFEIKVGNGSFVTITGLAAGAHGGSRATLAAALDVKLAGTGVSA